MDHLVEQINNIRLGKYGRRTERASRSCLVFGQLLNKIFVANMTGNKLLHSGLL
jgi:hypothetical protein